MEKSSTAFVGMDVHKESIDIAIADAREARLYGRVGGAIRSRHYSRRTEKTYWFWIRYFILHNNKRHPAEMGAAEVTAFLSWLAIERNVAAATQNQAGRAVKSPLDRIEHPGGANGSGIGFV